MVICAISDMHGNLDFTIDKCDLVLIAGDITPLNIQWSRELSEEWFKDTFLPWCNSLPCDKVVMVGGNHDKFLDLTQKQLKLITKAFDALEAEVRNQNRIEELFLKGQDKVVYLDCGYYEYKDVVIFGTPLCKIFGNWYFMREEGVQDEIYERFKDGKKVDILLCHDSPYGVSDLILEKDCPWLTTEHIGNKALTRLIESMKPKKVIHGHIHSSNHEMEALGESEVYCVSLLSEQYKMTYKPLYFTI